MDCDSHTDSDDVEKEYRIKVPLQEAPDDKCSGEDPPMSEWSSLEISYAEENKKQLLHSKGLYCPGEPEICLKYITESKSTMDKHPYLDFPVVTDPGIEAALRKPEDEIWYPEDGQQLYQNLCSEMNTCLVKSFYKNLLIPEINLSHYCVDPQGVRAMAMALQYNEHVQSLNLTDNFLNDDASYHLGQMLKMNNTLQELNLTGCRIGKSGLIRLCKHLPINRSVTRLNLSRNYLGDEGGAKFAKYIYRSCLSRLNLSNNQLGRLTATAFQQSLNYHNRITHLDLSWNTFDHIPSVTHMLERLGDHNNLEELNLAWSGLKGKRIARAIRKITLIPSLTLINLSNNSFEGEAVLLIIDCLKLAKNLKTLNFSFNPLSPDDAYQVIQKMLHPEVKIENLFLENICVNPDFMTCLERVKQLKCRRNFVIKYGEVLGDWKAAGPDPRETLLRRAAHMGDQEMKRKTDIITYLLILARDYEHPVIVRDLMNRMSLEHVFLDEHLLKEFAFEFPGPIVTKQRTIELSLVEEYIHRLWPEKMLPAEPPYPSIYEKPEHINKKRKVVKKKIK